MLVSASTKTAGIGMLELMQGSVNLTPEGATHLPRIRLIYGLILQRKKARAKNIIATVLILQKLFPQIFQCVIVARSEKY